jgi:hypothetical protein
MAWFYLLFVGGLLRLYGPVFAAALPFVTIAIGAVPLARRFKHARPHVAALRRRATTARPWWHWLALVFGLCGLGMVYFAILSPRNIAFDSHFYHLALAQQYATERAIRPSVEGWVPAAMPHLASVLYTWCFTLPGLNMFERITCAAHLEFVVFLFTLAGIPVLVRWLVPGARAGASWVALFLFPGILLYDSSLTAAADHVAALFTVPAYLALRRAWNRLSPGYMALFAAMLGGGLSTKYQAMYVAALPVVAILVRAAWLAGADVYTRLRRNADVQRAAAGVTILASALGVAVAAGVGLATTAPHWLKNWVWYGDPLFPQLHRIFPPDRWAPDLGQLFDTWSAWQTKSWVAQGTFRARLLETLEQTLRFSFEPHDWPKFHGNVPVFGSLFTLCLLVLPFVKGAKRTWGLVVTTHVGVFVWFWTMHQDRYLQVLVPWMAAVVAATIALAWRTNIVARVLAGALVGVQVIWGGDVYFIPGHAMTGASPARVTSELLAQGYAKQYDQRLEVGGALFQIGRAPELPAQARVLIHENNPRLGIWRPVVGDIAGWSYALRYELLESPAAVHEALRRMGITHIVARPDTSKLYDSIGADIRFYDYLEHVAIQVKAFGEFTLFRLPDTPPEHRPNDNVAYLGCSNVYEQGLHDLSALAVRDRQLLKPKPKLRAKERLGTDEAALVALISKADYAVTDAKCKPQPPPQAMQDLVKIATRETEQLWARRRARP